MHTIIQEHRCKYTLLEDVQLNNLTSKPISTSEATRERNGEAGPQSLRNPNILEGKSVEAVYAFPAAEWAHVYDPLA